MKKFHPDKLVGTSGKHKGLLSDALEKVQRAKQVVDHDLHQRDFSAPGNVSGISHDVLSNDHGNRKYRINWVPPSTARKWGKEIPPIEKYQVQIFDPNYGEFLQLAIIESEYCEELKRFRQIEEVRDFVLSETNLTKLRHCFDQKAIRIRIAAQNSVGLGECQSCIACKRISNSLNQISCDAFVYWEHDYIFFSIQFQEEASIVFQSSFGLFVRVIWKKRNAYIRFFNGYSSFQKRSFQRWKSMKYACMRFSFEIHRVRFDEKLVIENSYCLRSIENSMISIENNHCLLLSWGPCE